MQKFVLILYIFISFFYTNKCYAVDVNADTLISNSLDNSQSSLSHSTWQLLDSGLEYLHLIQNYTSNSDNTNTFSIHFLKIDPNLYNIELYGNFLEKKNTQYTLVDWCENKNLLASINASMYLPDSRTSTAYMRLGNQVNNNRITEKMGGFFLSKPLSNAIAESDIITKNTFNWQNLLENYSIVVQNFQIIGNFNTKNQQASLLWQNDKNRISISAIGKDIEGKIYFIFSEKQSSVHEFGKYLLSLADKETSSNHKIVFETVLYTEGGSEAGIAINTKKLSKFFSGLSIHNLLSFPRYIPNILGVTKK